MSYENIVSKIQAGKMTRADLLSIREKAEAKLKLGDTDAKAVLDAINISQPVDDYIVFMGFCPDADFENRLDIEWKEKGICEFDFPESTTQVERFDNICAGDLIVLKKRERFGETMKVYGHGRVKAAAYDSNGNRYLRMNWSTQNEIIEVPLMGCNSTVDVRAIDAVNNEMPEEFFKWLEA